MPNVTFSAQLSTDGTSTDRLTFKIPKSASVCKLPSLAAHTLLSNESPASIMRYAKPMNATLAREDAPKSHNDLQQAKSTTLQETDTSLELVETTNGTKCLLEASGTNTNHHLEAYSLSTQPSVVIQEIFDSKKDAKIKRVHTISAINDSLTNIMGRQRNENGSRNFHAKEFRVKNRRHGNDALSSSLSATYCKLLVLLGVCLPITDIVSDQMPTYIYQGFYVYLYSLSITFIIFLYASAYRYRTLLNALKYYHERSGDTLVKYKVTHFGSFYLRVGAIAFAIGAMVYSGLEFGQFFELNGQSDCHDIFVALTPICRMLLCIGQIQFIFLNTTYMDLARHKVTSRFGLMHMVATNLCEWLYVLVEETKHEIYHFTHIDDIDGTIAGRNGILESNSTSLDVIHNGNTTNLTRNYHTNHGCSRTTIMGALVQKLSPFLFPCTVEYSLICAVILYEIWKTVKSIPDIDRARKNSIKPIHQKPAHQFSVDCSQSHKGLFFGILIIVTTIIAMIMYFVLSTQPGFELVATQEITLWETLMYCACAIAVIIGMITMRDLRYIKSNTIDEQQTMVLDNLLLVVAQTGVYFYAIFSILGSFFSQWNVIPDRIENLTAEICGLLQTSMQTMFVLNASQRRCKGAKQVRRKPGREVITFLLIANVAIWFMTTMIKGRAVFRKTHMSFYGVWAWTIITHVSMPLAIFYRFHSTICLFEVWKTTYKAKIQ